MGFLTFLAVWSLFSLRSVHFSPGWKVHCPKMRETPTQPSLLSGTQWSGSPLDWNGQDHSETILKYSQLNTIYTIFGAGQLWTLVGEQSISTVAAAYNLEILFGDLWGTISFAILHKPYLGLVMMAIVATSEPINAQTLLVYSPSHHQYVHIYI